MADQRITVYISIGNSDDKLPQSAWSAYVYEAGIIANSGQAKHGDWVSRSSSPYQNACWCVEVLPQQVNPMKDSLRGLAGKYNQDSIAWAVAPVTEFLAPEESR